MRSPCGHREPVQQGLGTSESQPDFSDLEAWDFLVCFLHTGRAGVHLMKEPRGNWTGHRDHGKDPFPLVAFSDLPSLQVTIY